MSPIHRFLAVHAPALIALTASSMLLTGCEAIKSIFKAGVWVGVIAAVIAIGVVGGIAALARRG